MYNIAPNLVRSGFLWFEIKKILKEKSITVTELAEKSWITRPSLTNVLNWKKSWSDELFRTAMESIPITDTEIKKIFMEADRKEFEYKYWKEIDKLPLEKFDLTEFEKEELWKVLFSKVVWVEPTKQDVEAMLEMIRLSNRNKL